MIYSPRKSKYLWLTFFIVVGLTVLGFIVYSCLCIREWLKGIEFFEMHK